MKKRVLVTGSEGFIGSHLVESLVKRGYDMMFVHLFYTIHLILGVGLKSFPRTS